MKKVMVLGAGVMGGGIAQTAALSGYDVKLWDMDTSFVEKGIGAIEKSLNRSVEKGKIPANVASEAFARISGCVDFSDGKDADIVIEAVVENVDIKKKVYTELDDIMKEEAILASNTSSLSITELGAATKRPDRVIGMHFFNPVPLMRLVEIIKGAGTSDKTYEATYDLALKFKKEPIKIDEAPGFAVNRILIPMINEAVYVLMEGVSSAEDIDTAMKLGANHPIGPLALGDMVGLDVCLAIMEVLHADFGEDKYRPCPLLRKMVRAGFLGRKSGRGFFEYA